MRSLYISKNNSLVIHSKCECLDRKMIRTSSALELESSGNCNRIVLVYEECLLSELPLQVLRHYCELMRPLESKDLRFKKLSDFAIAPARATYGSVGYDLYSAVNMTILFA